MRIRAFLRERGSAGQFWIETGIDFGKRMNDRLAPVMVNDLDGSDSTRAVAINKLFGRFLESFGVKDRCPKSEYASAKNGQHEEGLHAGA